MALCYFLWMERLQAQQDPQYTQYMYNTMMVNPGYTGSPGTLEANLIYRSQWVGVDGAPETQSFGIHSPLRNENIGVGLNVVNDKIGPANQLYFNANFSYTIRTGYNTELAFGIKGGMKVMNIDFSKGTYYNPVDDLLNQNIDGKILPTVGAGLYFYSDKWYVGFSIPNFLKTDYYDYRKESVLSNRLHYYIIGGYVFDLSPSIKFKPATMIRIVDGAPTTVNVSANFLFRELLTVGVSYRYDHTVNALVGIEIFNSFFVGYSYDFGTSDFRKYNDGSHEIILRYHIPMKSKRIKSPRFF